jgi:hypothetical protein
VDKLRLRLILLLLSSLCKVCASIVNALLSFRFNAALLSFRFVRCSAEISLWVVVRVVVKYDLVGC